MKLNVSPEIIKADVLVIGGGVCRKEKIMGFFMKSLLLSFSFLCNEEICSISSNLIIARPFLPSAVNVALASTVPCK